MEQRCFNDLLVSIYRLLYKKFLSTMIKIRKPNVQQPLPRERGINNGPQCQETIHISRKRIETKQFGCKENVYWRRFKPVSSYVLSPGSGVPFHLFLATETDKEQGIYEKQHIGILLNIPWHLCTLSIVTVLPLFFSNEKQLSVFLWFYTISAIYADKFS